MERERVDVDEGLLAEVPFGRSRLLRALGAGLFGFAVQMVSRADPAAAHHTGVPYGCYGARKCHHCWYEYCTAYCSYPFFLGCRSGGQCWTSCPGNGYRYRCCDYREKLPNHSAYTCICNARIGFC